MPPPRAPTNPPETRRNTAAAVTPSPPSPARRRPAATGHPSPRRDYPKVELDLLGPLDTFPHAPGEHARRNRPNAAAAVGVNGQGPDCIGLDLSRGSRQDSRGFFIKLPLSFVLNPVNFENR